MIKPPTDEEREMLRALTDRLASDDRFTEWEHEFLTHLGDFPRWSDRQREILVDIWAKVMAL